MESADAFIIALAWGSFGEQQECPTCWTTIHGQVVPMADMTAGQLPPDGN